MSMRVLDNLCWGKRAMLTVKRFWFNNILPELGAVKHSHSKLEGFFRMSTLMSYTQKNNAACILIMVERKKASFVF